LAILGVSLGYFLPDVFINLRPFVIFLFGIMTFSGALKLTAIELKDSVRSPLPIFLFFFTSHVLMPVIALLLSSNFFSNPDLIVGFVLLFSGPTAVSGFIWITIFKGDKALGLTLILINTILAPLIVPATLLILIGQKITMNMSGIAISLLFMVVIPTIIGVGINEISKGKMPAYVCPYLDPVSKICLMFVIAANASALAGRVHFNDPLIWKVAGVCIALTVFGFFMAKAAAVLGKCRKDKTVTMVIAGGLRNNSAIMTLAVTFFPEAAALPTVVSIMTQQSIAAFAGKLAAKKQNDE
jgi:tagaturonate reductase